MRAAKFISVAVVSTLAVATGCNNNDDGGTQRSVPSANAPAGLEAFYQQKPSWKDCRDGFQCATVQVPLDYTEPAGAKVGISVIRLPAQNKSVRIGSLLTNPGGPGGSGVNFVRQAARAFGNDLRDRFDIVGFDPRGVAGSAPVRCNTGPQLDDFFATDASPDDKKETDALATEGQEFAQNCKSEASAALPHVGTVNAARDMDVLRAALGDPKLTYYGASYGTYLGAFYAEQFPRNIRAFVLDGAVDPTLSSTDVLIEQAKGFETALRAFADDCVRAGSCRFGNSVDAVLATISAFLAKTDKTPLTNSRDSRKVTESLAVMGLARALYVKEYWPVLRQALTQAIQKSDGTMLLTLADEMVERKPDGSYSNQTDANMAVNCVDKPNPPDAATYAKAAAEAEKAAPRFGPFVVWGGIPCVYWPTQTKDQPKPITAKGAAPILVIGTLRDPATPYKWSQSLADQLSSGVLLTFDGDGHTAYLQGDHCITQATDNYLISTDPPKDGTTCR
ncbi:alpha/beta hydrolase family protein [Actinomadura pelletieri DSM 43383]|uniref:Alpha/beta hydrolase family protein n=1 Tax=Actinomadura pelletieri DSM 43383 TaxID=1120940 RepID=A0A495QG63_9ACTN|nr:alpha/beta hydrolase [Actinomadura pelletieri]RKS70721.1 alpha/beta hydrolase family protein [Actinomadura pelletieri DSM 43383]